MSIVYVEGEFVEEQAAKISVFDRGFQFGDGAFGTIQVQDGVPLFFEQHLIQLEKQCLSFNLLMPSVTRGLVEELVKRNHAVEGIWRLKILITGGDSPEASLPERRGRSVMLVKPFTPNPFKPLQVGMFPIPYSSCHASFKSLAHLNRFYVMEDAKKRGLDDCVTVTENGKLLEAAFGNLVWFYEKIVMTPDPSLPLYFGVTIKNVLKLAKEAGFEIQMVKMAPSDVPKEAVLFRTNTMQGIRPITQLGELTFKQNPTIETLLLKGYEQLIERQKKATHGNHALPGQSCLV
jgi:4-amino-4-deoxychorismate lyase